MEESRHLIPHITEQSNNWAVRVTILESIPTMVCNNGSKLKRYILTDKEGNEVMASIYGDEVDILSPLIRLFNVYDISNADVRSIDKKFRIVKNPFQWTIRRHTLIRFVPEARPNLTYFLDSLTPFSKISDASKSGIITADIMGIIIDVDEVRSVNHGRNNVQHFTIIDPEKIPLRISLWDYMIGSEGEALVQAAERHLPIVAKRLAIRRFNSISLSSRNSSSFAINPPLEVAANMRSWFLTIEQPEVELLRVAEASDYTKELVSSGKMKTYKLTEILSNAPAGDYWVRGCLRLINEDQKLYYVACSNCERKIKADIGLKYTCFLCNQNVIASLRPLVVMFVADETEKTDVVAVRAVAEQILNIKTSDMTELYTSGQQLNLNPLKDAFEGKTFLMLLRRTTGSNSETVRRLILLSYHEQTPPTSELQSLRRSQLLPITSATTDSTVPEPGEHLPLSPLKRQMSQVTITPESSSKRQLLMTKPAEDEGLPTGEKHPKND